MQNPTRAELLDLLTGPSAARRRRGLELHRQQVIADLQDNLDGEASNGDVDDVLAFIALEAGADLIDAVTELAATRGTPAT